MPSSKRHELFDRLRTVFASAADALLWFRTWSALEQEAVATHDPAEARRLYRALARSASWQCPMLEVHWVFAYPEEVLADSRRQDLLRRYVQPSMRQQWLASMRAQAGRPPEEAARAKVRMVGELSRAGVGLLGGTDSWIPFRFPGSSLHDELASFVAAGVSPMRALQSGDPGRGAVPRVGRPVGHGDAGQAR